MLLSPHALTFRGRGASARTTIFDLAAVPLLAAVLGLLTGTGCSDDDRRDSYYGKDAGSDYRLPDAIVVDSGITTTSPDAGRLDVSADTGTESSDGQAPADAGAEGPNSGGATDGPRDTTSVVDVREAGVPVVDAASSLDTADSGNDASPG